MWVVLSLICALTLAASDTIVKKVLAGGADVYSVAWLRTAFSVPLLLGVLFFIDIPPLDWRFYAVLACGMPFELLALVLHTKALRASPMSLTLPFLAFTPVFLILSSYVLLGERVSTTGAVGIGLVVGGSYVLNISSASRGLLDPIRAIAKEKGSMMMLAVAAIYSVTASLLKLGLSYSSAEFYAAIYYAALAVVSFPLGARGLKGIGRVNMWWLVGAGVLGSVMLLANMMALALVNVAYMISVKRTSLLFGALMGIVFLGEKNAATRIAGAALMFAGFVVLVNAAQ